METPADPNADDELTVSRLTPPGRALPRRAALRRLTLIACGVAAVVAAEACGCVLLSLSPKPISAFGGPVRVGDKLDFPAAKPQGFRLGRAGVFYRGEAHAFIVHLSAGTSFQLAGSALTNTLAAEELLRDVDGSYWAALFQICTHDTTTLKFRACGVFNCPSCGATYACDGEYLDGPAPRSMDRFSLRFDGDTVVVDTSQIVRLVSRPDLSTRLLPAPDLTPCFAEY